MLRNQLGRRTLWCKVGCARYCIVMGTSTWTQPSLGGDKAFSFGQPMHVSMFSRTRPACKCGQDIRAGEGFGAHREVATAPFGVWGAVDFKPGSVEGRLLHAPQ